MRSDPRLKCQHLMGKCCSNNFLEENPTLQLVLTVGGPSRPNLSQCLFLDQIAVFFREIEDGTRQMPKQLATAKQVLLNKNGLDNPMQKRIISLLPIFLLAYTGLRFRQLQIWQNNVFPRELKGGIKGRTMSEIPTDLRLCIDSAKQDKAPVVGIKLDKSKCFDKIVHSTAAVLVLSLDVQKM